MGFLTRRIVGYVVFLTVLGALSTIAVAANESSGGTLFAGVCGVAIGIGTLAAALLSSWTVRRRMKRRAKERTARHR